MDKKAFEKTKDRESSQQPVEKESEQSGKHETDKRGQRTGGIDKKGVKEKDEHGEL